MTLFRSARLFMIYRSRAFSCILFTRDTSQQNWEIAKLAAGGFASPFHDEQSNGVAVSDPPPLVCPRANRIQVQAPRAELRSRPCRHEKSYHTHNTLLRGGG